MAELAAQGLIRSIGVSKPPGGAHRELVAETGLTRTVDEGERGIRDSDTYVES